MRALLISFFLILGASIATKAAYAPHQPPPFQKEIKHHAPIKNKPSGFIRVLLAIVIGGGLIWGTLKLTLLLTAKFGFGFWGIFMRAILWSMGGYLMLAFLALTLALIFNVGFGCRAPVSYYQ